MAVGSAPVDPRLLAFLLAVSGAARCVQAAAVLDLIGTVPMEPGATWVYITDAKPECEMAAGWMGMPAVVNSVPKTVPTPFVWRFGRDRVDILAHDPAMSPSFDAGGFPGDISINAQGSRAVGVAWKELVLDGQPTGIPVLEPARWTITPVGQTLQSTVQLLDLLTCDPSTVSGLFNVSNGFFTSRDGSTTLAQRIFIGNNPCPQSVPSFGVFRASGPFEIVPSVQFVPARSISYDGSHVPGANPFVSPGIGQVLTLAGIQAIQLPPGATVFGPAAVSGNGQVYFGNLLDGTGIHPVRLRQGPTGPVADLMTGFVDFSSDSEYRADFTGDTLVSSGLKLWTPTTGSKDLLQYAANEGALGVGVLQSDFASLQLLDLSPDGTTMLFAAGNHDSIGVNLTSTIFRLRFCPPACAEHNFNAGSHFFNDAQAWVGGAKPASSLDTALFNSPGANTLTIDAHEVSGAATISNGDLSINMISGGYWELLTPFCPCRPWSVGVADLPGSSATLSIQGATEGLVCNKDVVIGAGTASHGAVIVGTGASLSIFGNGLASAIRAAYADNSTGDLDLQSGSQVIAAALEAGVGTNAVSVVSLNNTALLTVSGRTTIGVKGHGAVAMFSGGTLDMVNLTMAAETGSDGSISATGSASQISVTPSSPALVGKAGEALITLEGGADLDLSPLSANAPLVLGAGPGGNGTLTLNGSGSSVKSSNGHGQIVVGGAVGAVGNLEMSASTSVNLGSMVVGDQPGSNGTVSAFGAVVHCTDESNPTIIGRSGTALVGFEDCNVTTQDVIVGADGATANANLIGGTAWFARNVTIGQGFSPGNMTVGSGSTLELSGIMSVGFNGALHVNGDVFFGSPPLSRDAGSTERTQPAVRAAGLDYNGGVIDATGSVTFGPGAIIGGQGPFTSPLVNNGTVRPAGLNHTGFMNADAGYTQLPGGVLEIEMDQSQFAFDSLNVSGTAALDSTLRFRFIGPVTPTSGLEAFFLSASSFEGGFSAIETVGLPPSHRVIVKQNRFGMNATVTCRGDLNLDYQVTTADLTLLLLRFGQSVVRGSETDLTPDGTVNTSDLVQLLLGFGTQCPPI